MIRKILLTGIVLGTLLSGLSFAGSLDDQYIDLIFDKFDSYDEETKEQRKEYAEVFMENEKSLDVMYAYIIKNNGKAMESYNITEDVLRKNIDELKKWTVDDRKALVEAGASGNKAGIIALNNKYAEVVENTDSSASSSSGGSGGGGGGSSGSGGGTTTETKIKENTTEVKKEIIKSDFEAFANITKEERKVKLEKIGLVTKEKVIIEKLRGKTFNDIKSHWAKDDVTFLAERGIISGRDSEKFDAEANVTKAETIKLLLNLIVDDKTKLPENTEVSKDVTLDKWYAEAIGEAVALKLIEKNEEGNLEPDKALTRGEVVEILVNAIKAMGVYVDEKDRAYPSQFTDFEKVQDFRKESMAVAINLGFVNGMGDGSISPDKLVTRGQMSTLMKKVYLYLMDQI